MSPSTSKTTVILEEDSLIRKRVLSRPTDKDQNNNNVKAAFEIEDINYLTPKETVPSKTKPDYSNWKAEIRWPDTIVQIFLHSGFLYGLYLLFSAKFYSILWCEYSESSSQGHSLLIPLSTF